MQAIEPDTVLPDGAPLSAGELPLVNGRFMLSTLAFHLHTQLTLTNRRLHSTRPTTLLGIVPVGRTRSDFPIENIAGIRVWTQIFVQALVLGVPIAVIGFALVFSLKGAPAYGVPILLVGLWMILISPRQAIQVMNSGGGTIGFQVSVFDRKRAVEFTDRVATTMAQAAADRISVQAAIPPVGDTQNASASLRRLEDLRTQGLISNNEYEAKRAEILARL